MTKPEKRQQAGRCLLTGDFGPMAKSHIIPKAFMRRADVTPFMESDGQSRAIKRQTGWYDTAILGSRGERHISKFDDAAAKCFIDGSYLYRTRRDPNDLDIIRGDFHPGSVIEVENVDTAKIRLFALSLLWRAAVSELSSMQEVKVRAQNIEEIGKRIFSETPGSPRQFAVYFCVFDSGEELPKVAPFRPGAHPFYRFFLDGVVAYVCPRKSLVAAPRYGRLLVGTENDRFPMLCLPSIGSAHAEHTLRMGGEILAREGNIFAGFNDGRL